MLNTERQGGKNVLPSLSHFIWITQDFFTLKAIRRLSGDDANLVAIACKTMNTIFYTEKEREEMIQTFREEVTKWENLLRQLEGNGTRIVTLLKESKYFIDIRHRMKSHLSVDWMVTEWWLNGDWMMTGKVDFSRISVTIQWPFSRLNGRHISVTFQSA